MNGTDYIAKEKARLKALLSNFSKPLEDEKVPLDLSDKGALHAEGFQVEGKPIYAFAYLFETQEAHNDMYTYLKNEQNEGKFYTLIASNGGWLLWTYSEKEEAALEYVIFDLAAAFSGEE